MDYGEPEGYIKGPTFRFCSECDALVKQWQEGYTFTCLDCKKIEISSYNLLTIEATLLYRKRRSERQGKYRRSSDPLDPEPEP